MTGTVPPGARRIAAQLADAFDRDQQLAVALNEAQQRLQAACDTAILPTMEPRERVLGPIARPAGQDEQGDPLIEIDFGNLVRKLILSKQIVVQSVGLKEIPLLIQKFGYDGVKALLESGRVRMLADGLGA